MAKKQFNDTTRSVPNSDYHPGLVVWKPLEEALRAACISDGDFPAASLIDSLKGILPPQEVNCLHNLRLTRNKLIHHEEVSLIGQSGTGMTTRTFTEECERLSDRLYRVSQSERERAHKNLISGIETTTPEQEAWGRLVARLRELTSQRSPFECIDAFSDRAPRTFIDKLHQLRKRWAAIYHGETTEDRSFTSEISNVLGSLEQPRYLLSEKGKEERTSTARRKFVRGSAGTE
jgi:hypothetical protein